MTSIYLIGSLRNTEVPLIGDKIRQAGFEAFDQWYSAGPEADDHFKQYHIDRGNSYAEALKSYAAKHIFSFDKFHLDRCDAAILILPAGRSCHIELGYVIGQNKPGYVLLDNEEARWDLMYQFATGIYSNLDDLIKELKLSTSTSAAQCEGSPISTSVPFMKLADDCGNLGILSSTPQRETSRNMEPRYIQVQREILEQQKAKAST